MKFKLKNIASNVSETSVPTDRTHTLMFSNTGELATPGTIAYGQSNIALNITAEEAAGYTLGATYELALTLVS
ncbi:hypothetical protein [Stenotrophomonas oahuensis]|uniref:Uncharacterized protein n=1 Tax=Stenotrophomonas oahuensis TaxID=3003271 RepID=A0ABY9YNE2_9GAMM|nr:hypothetical protein [Stenotrophomonas sp. A5586]WNH52423.1 hypothetical protein PDM29_19205 [Stenotrophomonas sp. A5586]